MEQSGTFVWTIVVVCMCTRTQCGQKVASGDNNLLLGTEDGTLLLNKLPFRERNKLGDVQFFFLPSTGAATHASEVSGRRRRDFVK